MDVLLLVLGIVTLVASGDLLVKYASGIAIKASIPPLIVGLTIVSIGTSAPEIIASVRAALEGNPGITLGNVIGSNIANLALILGATALIHPVGVDRSLMRSDWPVMMVASAAFWFFISDGELEQWEGFALLMGAVALLCMLYFRSQAARQSEAATGAESELLEEAQRPIWKLIGGLAAACVGLYFGSEWFIDGARNLAAKAGVSDHIIGLTIVAFGTSVPELVASGMAAWKKESDLALGNLIGSNIFNIFLAAGLSAAIVSLPVEPQALEFDMWWMFGIAAVVGVMMMHKGRVHRWKGLILFGLYLIYMLLIWK